MRKLGWLMVAMVFLQACGSGPAEQGVTLKEGINGKYYGGTLKLNEVEFFKSLYPLNITEVTGHRTITPFYA